MVTQFLALTLIALTSLSGLALLQKVSLPVAQGRKACTEVLLGLESNNSRRLKKLLALNPKARRLIQKRRRALAKLASLPVNAPAAAAALAELAFITTQQLSLRLVQESLLTGARRNSLKIETHFSRKLKKLRLQTTARSHYLESLAVEARQKNEIAPEYRTQKNFSHRQKKTLKWQMQMRLSDLKGIGSFLPERALESLWKLKGQCQTTLKKENLQWRPKIVEANS